jgi:Protein of unknown function (DUF3800)
MLKAYVDESGLHADPRVFVMAGYVAPDEVWQEFEVSWREMLNRMPVPDEFKHFHATDLQPPNGQKEFRRLMNQSQRDAILEEAELCAKKSGILGSSITVFLHAYEQIFGPVREFVGDPYTFAFQALVVELSHRAELFLGCSNERIAFYFAEQGQWRRRAEVHYAEMRQDIHLGCRERLGPITFAAMKKVYPLQVADHLAYETYRAARSVVDGEATAPERAGPRFYTEWNQSNGKVYNERGCRILYAKLKEDGIVP